MRALFVVAVLAVLLAAALNPHVAVVAAFGLLMIGGVVLAIRGGLS